MICCASPSKNSTLRQNLACQFQSKSPDVRKDEEDVRQAVRTCHESGEQLLRISFYASLRTLPVEEFELCGKLVELHMTNNYNLNRISDGALACLPMLEVLNLSYNSISVFPEEICGLKFLQRLLLNNNHFQKLPENIDALAESLLELNVDNNYLSSFPPAVLRLRRLVKLSTYNNPLMQEDDAIPDVGLDWESVDQTIAARSPVKQEDDTRDQWKLIMAEEEGVIAEADIPADMVEPKPTEEYCSNCLTGAGSRLRNVFVFVDLAGNKNLPCHYVVCSPECQKAVVERSGSESVNFSLLKYD